MVRKRHLPKVSLGLSDSEASLQPGSKTLQSLESTSNFKVPSSDNKENYNSQDYEIIQIIIKHSLEFNHKQKMQDLNLLDILNSYDEVIKIHSIKKEQSQRIYRKLLQMQKENKTQDQNQERQALSCKNERLDSEYSTMNQDLQFDFQGSFGGLNNHLRHQSQKRDKSTKEQSQHNPSVTKLPRPPSMLGSQFSGGGALSTHAHRQSMDRPPSQNHFQHLSLFDSHLGNQIHSVSSAISTLNQPELSQQDTVRDNNFGSMIKLPKLSFNDLIQAQNYESFKRNAPLMNEESTEFIQTKESFGPYEDDEELKSNDMSAFQSASKPHRHDDSSLRYSVKQSQEISQQQPSLATKLPKLKLVTDSEMQSIEQQVFTLSQHQRDVLSSDVQPDRRRDNSSDNRYKRQGSNQRKENVIDSDHKLSLAFQTRKLLLKAWKSWMIVKMHRIHKAHLERLSKTYKHKSVLHKFFNKFKLYAKIIAPKEKLNDKAKEFMRLKLQLRVFNMLKTKCEEKREVRAKLISTQMVLRRQRLRIMFDRLKRGVQLSHMQRTQKYTAFHLSFQRLKLKAFRSLQYMAQVKRRQSMIRQRTILFYQQSLAKKALAALQLHAYQKSQLKKQMLKARVYFRNHYTFLIKNKAYQVLRQFAIHSKKNKQADSQRKFWLLHVYFKSFKYNLYLKKGVKTQVDFVTRYYNHALLLKAFKTLILNKQDSQDRHFLIMNYLQRSKLRKLFRCFSKYAINRRFKPVTHGRFIDCARLLLEQSFSDMMQSVWLDFPKMKLSQDPQSQKQSLMLNYIGLAKNQKYRQLFWKANENLRSWVVSRVFQGMKKVVQHRIGFRHHLKQKQMYSILNTWKYISQRQSTVRYILNSKSQTRNLFRLLKTFKAMRSFTFKNKKTHKSFFKLLLKKKQQLLSDQFTLWHGKFKKAQAQHHNEEIAEKIYKHRNLTKFLALWLKQLHFKLKQDHLDILLQKFQKFYIRRRFLRQWQTQYEKHQYLEEQEQNLNQHQTNLLLYKCFAAMKESTQNSIKKKQRQEAASQEYRYWLGKRAIFYLKQGLSNIKTQKQLYDYLDQDRAVKVMSKVFGRLAMFKDFKVDRKIRDQAITKEVQVLLKKGFMDRWMRQFKQGMGTRMLGHVLDSLTKRQALNQIRHIVAFEESVVDVMQSKHESYLKLGLLNMLKLNIKRKNVLHRQHRDLSLSHTQNTQSTHFKKWVSTYKQRRRLYMTYAFTVIQLKNSFLSNCLKDWLHYVKDRKVKVQSKSYFVSKRKRQVFRALKLKYLKTQHNFASYEYLKQQLALRCKSNKFSEWRTLFLNAQKLLCYQTKVRTRKLQLCFQALLHHKQHCKEQHSLQQQRIMHLNTLRESQMMLKWRQLTMLNVVNRSKVKSLRLKHQHTLFTQSVQLWIIYYQQNQTEISHFCQVKKHHALMMKSVHLKRWLFKAQPRLKKLKALKLMINFRNRRVLDKRFATWVDQTNFLISLEMRVAQILNHKALQDKIKGISQLRQFTEKRVLYKQRENDIKLYAEKKLLMKSLISMAKYLNHRRQQVFNKDQAFRQYLAKVKQHGLMNFRLGIFKQRLLKSKALVFKNWLQSYKAPKVFEALISNQMKRKESHNLRHVSLEFRVANLLSKALKSFKNYQIHKQSKRKLLEQTDFHYHFSILGKMFKRLKLYSVKHRIVSQKRRLLFETIKLISNQSCISEAFSNLLSYKLQEQKTLNQNWQLLKTIKTKKVFDVLRYHKDLKSDQRSSYEAIRHHQTHKAKAQHYFTWRKLFLRHQQVTTYLNEKQFLRKRDLFNVLKKRQILAKNYKLIQLSQQIKTKAIVLTVLIQYHQHRQMKVFKLQQAELQYNRHLASTVFKAYEYLKDLELKVTYGQGNGIVHLKRKALFALARNLELIKCVEGLSQIRQRTNLGNCFQSWLNSYARRQAFKVKLANILSRFETQDKQQCFRQWKRGAFFMRMCELISTYRYKEQEDTMLSNCFTQWQRLIKHLKNRDYHYDSLQINHHYHTLRQVFGRWKCSNQVRCKILALKLEKLIQPRYQESLQALYDYSVKDQDLSDIEDRLMNKKEKKVKRQFFYQWMIRLEQKEQLSIYENKKHTDLAKKALKALELNRLIKMQDKYQMLRVIQHFSVRRPELLLCFSKTFLGLNSTYSSTLSIDGDQKHARICSTALAKYVFEKWKNVKDVIQVNNDMHRQADTFYVFNLAKRHFDQWRENINITCQKRSLKLSVTFLNSYSYLQCKEFYYVNLMKKGLSSLKSNVNGNFHKIRLRDIKLKVASHRLLSRKSGFFHHWRMRFLGKVRSRTIENEVATKSYLTQLYQIFQVLRNQALKNRSMRMRLENARDKIEGRKYNQVLSSYFCALKFYTRRMKQKRKHEHMLNERASSHYNARVSSKIFKEFKACVLDQKIKSKYSRLYTVFVAWKFYIKEKTLLNKYLNECNYQSQASKGKQSRGSSLPAQKILNQQKENCKGMNDSSSGLQMQRMQRHMSKQELNILQPKSNYENYNDHENFTPTLGQSVIKHTTKDFKSIESNQSKRNDLQIFRQRFYN